MRWVAIAHAVIVGRYDKAIVVVRRSNFGEGNNFLGRREKKNEATNDTGKVTLDVSLLCVVAIDETARARIGFSVV